MKSKLWPCSPTFQMACVLSALRLVSIRFICLLLPYFPIIALVSCSLGQSYIHWIGHSESPNFPRSFMFTQAAIVFKFQLRVRAQSLCEACQNQTLVNEKKTVARLSDAPCWPSSLKQEGILSCSSGTYCGQQGVNKIARRSTRSGSLEIRNLYNQGNLSSPI